MVNQTIQGLSVLDNAQDLIVVRPNGVDSYVFAVKPSLDFQRKAYEDSVSDPNDSDISAFDNYWKFDNKQGIKGSSTFLALRFDKKALRPKGLWLPGLLEAKALESAGKLENSVYRDYNLVVCSDGVPDKQIAKSLVSQANELGLKLPLVVPFMALDYNPNKKAEHGIDVSLIENSKGIISGKEAVKQINSLDYKANSGVLRLVRDGLGIWCAYWSDLVGSNDSGRVDWICGEATQKI